MWSAASVATVLEAAAVMTSAGKSEAMTAALVSRALASVKAVVVVDSGGSGSRRSSGSSKH